MNLTEAFVPQELAFVWSEVYSNSIPYLGSGLFPARKKMGLDLSWIRGNKGLPVSLMPSTFDAKATFRDRVGFERLETEMPFFREGFKLKEKDRQELLRIEESGDPYVNEVINRIYDDANELINAAEVVAERMRMQLLFPEDGKPGIVIKANGVDYTYDYDPDGSWNTNNYLTLGTTEVWTETATADPFKDFKAAKDNIRASTGTELTTAIMNTYTFNLLSGVDAVKNRFLTTIGRTVGFISDNDVRDVFQNTSGVSIVVYDKEYRDEDKTAHAFVPNGYVAIVPSGALGNTWYGTTPEEADGNASGAEVSIVNTGVAITRIVDPHPVNVNIFASEIVLPSYERMNEVALLKVTS